MFTICTYRVQRRTARRRLLEMRPPFLPCGGNLAAKPKTQMLLPLCPGRRLCADRLDVRDEEVRFSRPQEGLLSGAALGFRIAALPPLLCTLSCLTSHHRKLCSTLWLAHYAPLQHLRASASSRERSAFPDAHAHSSVQPRGTGPSLCSSTPQALFHPHMCEVNGFIGNDSLTDDLRPAGASGALQRAQQLRRAARVRGLPQAAGGRKLRVLKWHRSLQEALRCWHVLAEPRAAADAAMVALHYLHSFPAGMDTVMFCSRTATVRTCRSFRR